MDTRRRGGREKGLRAVSRPEGRIQRPKPGERSSAAVVMVTGWALLPGESVVRVEILLDGLSVGSARTGLARMRIRRRRDHPEAAACGFAFDLCGLQPGAGARRVRIGALVHGRAGTRFSLPEVEVTIGPAVEARGRPTEPSPTPGGQAQPAGDGAARRHETAPVRALGATVSADRARRLLVLAHNMDYGGAQLYLVDLLARLSHDGFAPTVVAGGGGPLTEVLEHRGVPVHLTGRLPTHQPHEYEAKLRALEAWAAPQGFGLVLGNTVGSFPAADLGARLGVPSVMVVHESSIGPCWEPSERWHEGVAERARWALRTASAVVFGAEATSAQYRHLVDDDRRTLVPFGVPVDAITRYRQDADRGRARERFGLSRTGTVVLCLGRVEQRKGQTSLVRAFSMVAERHPDAHLWIVGDRGGGYSRALRAAAHATGLEERISISGVCRDAYACHIAADVLVVSSDRESLPRALLEGMAFETPVLATRVLGIPEAVDDGRTGYLCAPRDVGALADGLERVLGEDHDRRRAVALAGARYVRTERDADLHGARFGALLDELVEAASAPAEPVGA